MNMRDKISGPVTTTLILGTFLSAGCGNINPPGEQVDNITINYRESILSGRTYTLGDLESKTKFLTAIDANKDDKFTPGTEDQVTFFEDDSSVTYNGKYVEIRSGEKKVIFTPDEVGTKLIFAQRDLVFKDLSGMPAEWRKAYFNSKLEKIISLTPKLFNHMSHYQSR